MKHLVFGPGAMGYFMYLGALSALQDSGALNELETIHGASAGGLLAFIYLLTNRDIKKALDYSLSVPIKDVMKPNIKVLLKSYGLVSTKKVYKVLQDATRTFIKQDDVTFAELYEHVPVKLYISACCVDLHTTHYFSVDTTPNMSVLDAICMTIAIPFLFQSVRHGSWHYIDGGSLEAIPGGSLIGCDPKRVLAFTIGGEWIPHGVRDIKTYTISIVGAFMGLRHKYTQIPRIDLDAGLTDTFDFGASSDNKFRLFLSGYTTTKKYLCRVNGNDPACCVHTHTDATDDPCLGDTDASGILVPSTGVEGPRQVGDDQEPGSPRQGTEDSASPSLGYALDVRILDGCVTLDTP